MNRLPGYDRTTSGSELAVFLGLGLVGLTLIGASFSGSLRFALHRDSIITAVSGELSSAMAATPERVKTNVAVSSPQQLRIQARQRQPSATPCCISVQSL